MLKIGIVGVGGVGGYIGAKLIQKGLAEITLFARGKSYETIKNGLKVIDCGDEFVVRPKNIINTENDKSHEIFDIIFITTKSYSFKDISKVISLHVDENTLIIPLSNGVNHKAELGEYIKKATVLDGCVYVLSNIKEAGVIEKKAPTFYLVLGDYKNRFQDRLQALVDILNQSELKSKLSQKIEYDCWTKYLLISSFATLTSYFKAPMGFIIEKKTDLLRDVLEEIKNVANAQGIDIGEKEIEKTIKQVQNVPYNSKTSMQIDFENHNKTELESISGYIVNTAKKSGVKADNMKMMYEELSKRSL